MQAKVWHEVKKTLRTLPVQPRPTSSRSSAVFDTGTKLARPIPGNIEDEEQS